jgi:Rieske 2Fe-2S family protein
MKSNKKMPVLPVEAYTSQEWFDKEQELIFSKVWQFAGLLEDIKEPGDYISVQAGLNNIFIVKGRDQRLRAFHNMCRHRGTQLLRAVGKKQKAIICPYHDWTYDLEGNLLTIPEEKEEFSCVDKKQLGLRPASVDSWKGMLFVHPDPNAQPLMDWFNGVWDYLGPHKPENLVEYEGTVIEHVINANWKIVAENYIDVYHLSHLHSATLNMYQHDKAEFQFIGPHYVFWEPLSKEYAENLDDLIPYKRIPEVSDLELGAYVPWLFPNLGLGETESAWSIFLAVPLGPDKTKVIIRSKLTPVSESEYYRQERKSWRNWEKRGAKAKYEGDESDPMASGDFMQEDIFACEQQQKSLKSPYFQVGPMAERGESTVKDFQKIIAQWMSK